MADELRIKLIADIEGAIGNLRQARDALGEIGPRSVEAGEMVKGSLEGIRIPTAALGQLFRVTGIEGADSFFQIAGAGQQLVPVLGGVATELGAANTQVAALGALVSGVLLPVTLAAGAIYGLSKAVDEQDAAIAKSLPWLDALRDRYQGVRLEAVPLSHSFQLVGGAWKLLADTTVAGASTMMGALDAVGGATADWGNQIGRLLAKTTRDGARAFDSLIDHQAWVHENQFWISIRRTIESMKPPAPDWGVMGHGPWPTGGGGAASSPGGGGSFGGTGSSGVRATSPVARDAIESSPAQELVKLQALAVVSQTQMAELIELMRNMPTATRDAIVVWSGS